MTGDHSADGGRMLARTWTIAANYRTPADYDVPEAPTFHGERCDDGTFVLSDSESGETVLTARAPTTVRR
ncbi:hypothetical protein [Halorarius halobius]|uniref:hypothetical protein n=1 Tax=Halorarius halobius TaxID=2962671 RepID=UPI0020CD03D2|nr:hypothetical protein [Halorarius halobius]